MKVVDLVKEKIREDHNLAAEISSNLRREGKTGSILKDFDIRRYFPEIFSNQSIETSNIPRGVALRHYVLFGVPAVFDLEPLSSQEFQMKHRINIAAVEFLSERGLVFPNLYVRNPERWQNAEEMYGLVKRSYVNGERVDSYMALRGPSYSEKVMKHEADLSRLIRELSPAKLKAICEAANINDPSAFPRAVARRWGYLDVMAQSAAEQASRMFAKGMISELSEFIRIAKHLSASDITAAIGGKFTWGLNDLEILLGHPWIRLPSQSDRKETNERSISDALHKLGKVIRYPEAMEYLLQEMLSIKPFEVFDSIDAKALTRFLGDDENLERREQIITLTDDLISLALQNSLAQGKVEDFRKLVNDYQKRINYLKTATDVVTSSISSATGFLIGGVIGAVMGAVLGLTASRKSQMVSSALAKIFWGKGQRVIITLQALKRGNR